MFSISGGGFGFGYKIPGATAALKQAGSETLLISIFFLA